MVKICSINKKTNLSITCSNNIADVQNEKKSEKLVAQI